MSQLDHPSLLTRLIVASEAALQMRHSSEPEHLIDLYRTIDREWQKPVDTVRTIGPEVVMCAQALVLADRELRRSERHRADKFCRVVGVLLPDIRHALSVALEQRRRPTP